MHRSILGNPGVTHSVPTAFINAVGTEWVTPGLCSGYGMGHAWVTEDSTDPTRKFRQGGPENGFLVINVFQRDTFQYF